MEPRLHQAFLAELEALEKFRVAYSGMYPQVPLASEDPDVRRLLEALAMFTARTRVNSERNVEGALLRIVREHFPYLLSPIPAMFLLRGAVTRRYVDVSVLPRGTEVSLTRRGDGGAPDATFVFRTLAPLRLLPIELEGVDMLPRKQRGTRVLLRFAAAFPRSDTVDELPLHVDHLSDLHSSLLLLHALEQHLNASAVIWSHRVDAETTGEPCQIEFGPRPLEVTELEPFDHPLQQVRAALRFAPMALTLRAVGLSAPRNWQRFTIVLDLDEGFPSNLQLNVDCFQLHVVPVVNMRRATAEPIAYDGTRAQHRARHPEPSLGFAPVSIHGVYRKTPSGLAPLTAALIRGGDASYEAELVGHGAARTAYLTLQLPDAFESPETVVVEALWHQPAVSACRVEDCQLRLHERFVQGVEWGCLGTLCPHADSELDSDRRGMLELLSIRGQRLLGLTELKFLLHAFGVSSERAFERLLQRLAAVRVSEKPHVRRANGWKHVYQLEFHELTPSDLPRLRLLCGQLFKLLAAWAEDEVIELVASVDNLKKELRYV
jgi:type VI secretion system protein ImpG